MKHWHIETTVTIRKVYSVHGETRVEAAENLAKLAWSKDKGGVCLLSEGMNNEVINSITEVKP